MKFGGLSLPKNRVPIFRLKFDRSYRDKFYKGCERIFDEGFLTNHTYVREFEKRFAKFARAKAAVSVVNGTAALEVALRAANVRGKEVILPANTFIATAVAALNAGATIRVLDVEDRYYGLSANTVNDAISNRTGAVVCVHVGGIVSPETEKIAEICRRRGVPLIEDCAHAHGSRLGKTYAGSFGDAGCFSFHMTKVMTTGEGGMITLTNMKVAEAVRSVRQFGFNPQKPIEHVRDGGNFKMTEFQALAGVLELKRAKKRITRRQEIAKRYQKNLVGSGWLALKPPPNGLCSYYKQIILPPVERGVVEKHLKRKGIALTGGVYYLPLHQQPVLKKTLKAKHYPVANQFAASHICPPCYPELSDSEVDFICETMLGLYRD